MAGLDREIIAVAEWRPDMPDLATATSTALNVVPITPESYGPLPSLSVYSTSQLDSQCIGAIGVQSVSLAVYVFAGTTDKLYEIVADGVAWTDVSGTAYTTAPGDNWRFDLFNNEILATNFGNPIQSFSLASSVKFGNVFTAAAWAVSTAYAAVGEYVLAGGNRYVLTVAGTSAATGAGPTGTGAGIVDGTCVWNYQGGPPPQARHICTPKNFVMVGNTYDPVGGLGPQRVWWSASNDPTTWPSPGSNAAIQGMSDYNDFQGNFGEISGMVDSLSNADVAIFFRHAVWRGLFVGPPNVFDFFPAENVRGCPAPNSIVPLGATVWYLGEDGFYMFDGSSSLPIGADKFDAWFWNNVNASFLWMIIGAANVPSKLIMWAFPSRASSNGICDTILIYRWDIQRASYAFVGQNAVEWMIRTITTGVSLDGFSALGFTNLDTLPASLDSALWQGGNAQLGVINGAHQLAYFSGAAMAGQVATETKQLTPGRRTFVQSSRPIVDASFGTPSVALAGRTNLYDTETFGAAVAPDASGECPQRNDNRYHNAMISLPAGAVWTHISGVELTFGPAGFR